MRSKGSFCTKNLLNFPFLLPLEHKTMKLAKLEILVKNKMPYFNLGNLEMFLFCIT